LRERCRLPGHVPAHDEVRATRNSLLATLLALLVVSCATFRPTGAPIPPLTSTTPEQALDELRERREDFRGLRSLMRVRATTNGKTQSFRAQLAVHDAQRMELIAYTPVGTTALKLKANGNDIVSDPEVAPEAFEFLHSAGLTPAETAMLIAGLPPREDLDYEFDSAGLRRASIGNVVATFDPPAYPAKRVVVMRGDDRIEIEHLEVVR
jgi:hypothetical protein